MAWYDLLRKSIERELNAGQTDITDIIEKLDEVLSDWQENIPPVSFATAIMLENGEVKGAANPLPKPEDDDNNRKCLYRYFKKLTEKKPPSDLGKWPWDLLREGNLSESGIFPPKVLLLNGVKDNGKCSDNGECAVKCTDLSISIAANGIDPQNRRTEFYNGSNKDEKEKLSWKWYAAYPAILGDAIRNDGKETVALVYILGTRREFLQRERNRDYGLIVGLTSDAFDKERCLQPAADAILAAWNILAVSPHVVSDGQKMVLDAKKIAGLEAAQRLTHTFRTYVDAHALQKIEKWAENSTNKDKIIGKVKSINGLAGMMAFVAKDGINENEKLRTHEMEQYDLVKFISEVFTKELKNGMPNFPEPSINKPSEGSFDANGIWIPRLYLLAALMEIIKNIRQKAPQDDQINVTIECDKNNLEVTVINSLQVGIQSSGGQDKKVSGSHALDAFFRALGGKAEGYYSDADGKLSNSKKMLPRHYTWKVSYNLNAWNKKVTECSKRPDTTRDGSGGSESLTFDHIPKLTNLPGKETIALRVLVLDDELDANDLMNAFQNFDYFEEDNNGEKKCLWGWYKREFKKDSITFTCLYNKTMKMEVVCCPSVWWAREVLLGEHFDIALLDIDFGKDPAGLPPTLGGLLFGLGFLHTAAAPYCILHVFTAKELDLRRVNPDFRYLEELAKDKMLGKLEFQADNASKDLNKMLRQAFYTWCIDVLGYKGALKADPSTLINVGEFFYGGTTCKDIKQGYKKEPEPVSLDPGQRDGLSTTIPIQTFDALLDKDKQERKKLAAELMDVCGHAAVRNLFCTYAHNKLEKYIKNKTGSRQTLFNNRFNNACVLFKLDADEFMKMLQGETIDDIKKHYRLKVAQLGPTVTNEDSSIEKDPSNPIYLFGLWKNPDCYKKELDKALVDYLKDKNIDNFVLKIEISLLGGNSVAKSNGWTIRLIGNRTDNDFMHAGSGGTLNDLLENSTKGNLRIIASALIARSKDTCFDLLREKKVYCNCTDNNRIRQQATGLKPCRVDCGFSKKEDANQPSSLELLIVLHHKPKADD